MANVVHQLLATEAALDKLGARDISIGEAEQMLRNRHAIVRNVRGHPDRAQRETRRLLIGQTEGVDDLGGPYKVYRGADARVVINPETGRIVSVNPRTGAGANW